MNKLQAEVLGMKMDDTYIVIEISGTPTFAAKLLMSHVFNKLEENTVQIWVDFHAQKRFIGYQNPYTIYKLVSTLYSNFMKVRYIEDKKEVDIENWVDKHIVLAFDQEFDTIGMDL